MTPSALLGWLRRPLPTVEPAVVLCQHCGTRAAVLDDGEAVACAACVLRLTHLAAFPSLFSVSEIAAAWISHADVLELAQLPTDRHRVVVGSVMRYCQHYVTGWRWTADWPEARA